MNGERHASSPCEREREKKKERERERERKRKRKRERERERESWTTSDFVPALGAKVQRHDKASRIKVLLQLVEDTTSLANKDARYGIQAGAWVTFGCERGSGRRGGYCPKMGGCLEDNHDS